MDISYEDYTKNAKRVYEIISEYFGEDLTDFQGEEEWKEEYESGSYPTGNAVILIKFPNVTITNENNHSVNITNLFVRIAIKTHGTLIDTFKMLRTEYTKDEWLYGYVHSHADFDTYYPARFAYVCLGEGPLVQTTRRLRSSFDEHIWGLFCFELDKYVHIESIAGVPYRRLESIGRGRDLNIKCAYNPSQIPINYNLDWKKFIKHFIKEYPIKLAYTNDTYTLGEPYINFWVNISNIFIKWVNNLLIKMANCIDAGAVLNLLCNYIVEGSKVYSTGSEGVIDESLQGKELFVFKGEMQTLLITGVSKRVEVLLLNKNTVDILLTKILIIINSKYGQTKISGKYHYV